MKGDTCRIAHPQDPGTLLFQTANVHVCDRSGLVSRDQQQLTEIIQEGDFLQPERCRGGCEAESARKGQAHHHRPAFHPLERGARLLRDFAPAGQISVDAMALVVAVARYPLQPGPQVEVMNSMNEPAVRLERAGGRLEQPAAIIFSG
jgi:hypothetical protein